ncbi:cupin domain-containing protein, partial [Rhizobium ruizarguesonis]
FVIDGPLAYPPEGRPPVTLNVGRYLFIPPGVTHSAKNVGSGTASELATYIFRKGAPLVVPAK